MAYLPRPDANRTGEDVDEIYALAADELRQAETPAERRQAYRNSLLRAYEAGIDAQREILATFTHERPTPIPPPPVPGDEDPGVLPEAHPQRSPFPLGVTHPNEPQPKKR